MRTNFKKIFAVLLTVALVATMFVMPAGATTTYHEYLTSNQLNGDFEVGVVGMQPYGWGFKSIETNTYLSTTRDFTTKFTFKTVLDGDNKVAQITKIQEGYVAIVTQPIAITGGSEAHISFDYKVVETNLTPKENCDAQACINNGGCCFAGHFYGITIMVRQYDKDGNLIKPDNAPSTATDEEYTQPVYTSQKENGYGSEGVMSEYKTASHSITTFPNAVSMEVYLGTGGWGAVYPVVNIDNFDFSLSTDIKDDLLNGDFKDITTEAEGGKAAGIDGPLNWELVSSSNAQGTAVGSKYYNNYTFTTGTEVVDETTGEVNHFAQYKLIDSLICNSGVKGYCYASSNKIALPVASGSTFTVKYDFKSYAADSSQPFKSSGNKELTNASGTVIGGFPPSFRVVFYKADGTIISDKVSGAYVGIFSSSFTNNEAVADWTGYSVTAKVPDASYEPAYFRISIFQGGNGAETNLNAVYCFDNINIYYTVADESANSVWTEKSVSANGALYTSNESEYNSNYSLSFVDDVDRGQVIRLSGTDRLSNVQWSTGYVAYMSSQTLDVSTDKVVKASFDYKITGYDMAMRYHSINGGTVTGNIFSNHMAPQIVFHFYDADGNYISGLNNAKQAIAGSTNKDVDWSTKVGTLTAPDNAVTAKWGIAIYVGRRHASALIKLYYDNIVVKNSTDSYWEDNNLFNNVMLAEGNADEIADIDLVDLVRMNNKLNDSEGTVTTADTADMNKNGKIDAEDIVLLRWKLLGITNEADAVQ